MMLQRILFVNLVEFLEKFSRGLCRISYGICVEYLSKDALAFSSEVACKCGAALEVYVGFTHFQNYLKKIEIFKVQSYKYDPLCANVNLFLKFSAALSL